MIDKEIADERQKATERIRSSAKKIEREQAEKLKKAVSTIDKKIRRAESDFQLLIEIAKAAHEKREQELFRKYSAYLRNLEETVRDVNDTAHETIKNAVSELNLEIANAGAQISTLNAEAQKLQSEISAIDDKVSLARDTIKLLDEKTASAIDTLDEELQRSIGDLHETLKSYATVSELEQVASTTGDNTQRIGVLEARTDELEAKSDRTGEVFMWYGDECPAGSIPLDGRNIDEDALILAIGQDTMPDFRNMFVRVYDPRTGRKIGSFQDDATAVNGLSGSVFVDVYGSSRVAGGLSVDVGHYATNYRDVILRGDAETRPKNKYINLCMRKY